MTNNGFVPPRVIGHRGAAAHAPENTLAGLRVAAGQGVGWVEVDVKLTGDSVPILFHDDRLDRTTNGRGPVAALSLQDIQRLDAGNWFDPHFAGERVPTLADTITAAAALGLRLNLEIKPCPGRAEETAGIALSLARTLWPNDMPPPLVSSFDMTCLAMAQQVAPAWPRGLLIDRPRADWAELADRLEVTTININARKESAASVARYRASGRPVLAYTVNSPAIAREIFAWGVAGVFTDDPATLLAALPNTPTS